MIESSTLCVVAIVCLMFCVGFGWLRCLRLETHIRDIHTILREIRGSIEEHDYSVTRVISASDSLEDITVCGKTPDGLITGLEMNLSRDDVTPMWKGPIPVLGKDRKVIGMVVSVRYDGKYTIGTVKLHHPVRTPEEVR